MSNVSMTTIDDAVASVLDQFELPNPLGFGSTMVPIMYRADFSDGEWHGGRLLPYGPITLDPTAKVLHYAAEIFEGMKAFRVEQKKAQLFRPMDNFARLNNSARRMCMPSLPHDLFVDALFTLVANAEPLVPRQAGQSLYLRPFMIGTGSGLGLSASSTYSFFLIASPSEEIIAGSFKVRIEREDSRVPIGKMGAAKAGGNYAASLFASVHSLDADYDQTLWLDAPQRQFVDELSGMNFFCVVDGVIQTPTLSGSILAGITRDSVIQLAKRENNEVQESPIDIDVLIEKIQSGECTEAFCCGTAAIVAPIGLIGESDGSYYSLANTPGPVTQALRENLLGIQEGRRDDDMNWMVSIPDAYYPQ